MADNSDIPNKINFTLQQVGEAFKQFIVMEGKSNFQGSKDYENVLSSYSEFDRESIRFETMLMIGFINEYATYAFFRDKSERDTILTVYYSLMDVLPKKDDNWFTFDRELRKRIPLYSEAVKGGLGHPQLEEIGVIFARLCGHPDDHFFVIEGTTRFSTNYAATIRFLSEITIIF